MWSHQYSIITDASAYQIWRLCTDMNNWNRWDNAVEWCKLNGNFNNGIAYILKLWGTPKAIGIIRNSEHLKRFTTVSKVPLANIDFHYEMVDANEGVKLTRRISISGPLSFIYIQLIGKRTIKESPTAMKNLVELARQVTSK